MGDNYEDTIENFYFSASITNNTNTPSQALYNISRTQPILKDTENWELCFCNLSVPSTSIPLFIFEPANALPNIPPGITDMRSGYWVGIQMASNLPAPAYGIFFAPVLNSPPQIYNFQYNEPPDETYVNYIFDYQLFIQQVNNALAQAWNHAGHPGSVAPFIYYDPKTTLFSIYQDYAVGYFDGTPAAYADATKMKIYMNSLLYQFFRFNSIWNNANFYQFSDTGPDYIINFYASEILYMPNQFYDDVQLLQLTQPFQTLGLFSTYNKILISSNTLPVPPELQGNASLGSSNDSLPTLLTFEISNDQKRDGSDYVYQPDGGFKWISMSSQQQLSFFDINIRMQGDSSDVIPIYLMPGETISFKIRFRLKSKLVRKKYKNYIKR